jgi:hypothetical protein
VTLRFQELELPVEGDEVDEGLPKVEEEEEGG